MDKTSNLWRILQLLLLIQQNPGIKAKALAGACEISTRTVYRYIEILRMAGVQIFVENGYRITDNFYLPPTRLTLQEAIGLLFAGKNFESYGGSLFSGPLRGALEKIMATLPKAFHRDIKAASTDVLVGTAALVDYAGYSRIFKTIENAKQHHSTLKIRYLSPGKKIEEERLIDTYGLVVRGGFCYLVGKCHKRGKVRMFRIDRIATAHKSDRQYSIPADFSITNYMDGAWNVVRGKKEDIKVRFTGSAARIISEARWHPSQRLASDGDAVIASYKSGGLSEICTWILGFGGEAEVLEPLELRCMVAERAKAAAKRNKVSKPPAVNLRGSIKINKELRSGWKSIERKTAKVRGEQGHNT